MPRKSNRHAAGGLTASHSAFLPRLLFIDSRKRKLSPFISKMWQRCVSRSRSAAVLRSPWNTWSHSLNAPVARHQQAPPLVAVGEHLEQQLGPGPAERQVAQFVA